MQGEEYFGDYVCSGEGFEMYYCFCFYCGMVIYGYGWIEVIGGDFVGVCVVVLDDLLVDILMVVLIVYCDGFNDNWWNVFEDICYF